MGEIRKEVRTYRVDYACDVCGEIMEYGGICLTSYPPQYPHGCKNGHNKTFPRIYPCQVAVAKSDDEG